MNDEQQSPQANPFDFDAEQLRQEIKRIAGRVRFLRDNFTGVPVGVGADPSEMVANMMLSYRHLEDAAMRLGKAMQAYQGGVSILDRPATEIAEIQARIKG